MKPIGIPLKDKRTLVLDSVAAPVKLHSDGGTAIIVIGNQRYETAFTLEIVRKSLLNVDLWN